MLEQTFATTKDIGFISSCLLYGARKGHYAFNADSDQLVGFMKQEVHSLVEQQRLLDNRQARALIYSIQQKRVGLMILTDAGLQSGGIEIYALSVAQKYQGKGYGREILQHALECYFQQDIYARCSPSSIAMKTLLLSQGFENLGLDGEHQLLFRGALAPVDLSVVSVISG